MNLNQRDEHIAAAIHQIKEWLDRTAAAMRRCAKHNCGDTAYQGFRTLSSNWRTMNDKTITHQLTRHIKHGHRTWARQQAWQARKVRARLYKLMGSD